MSGYNKYNFTDFSEKYNIHLFKRIILDRDSNISNISAIRYSLNFISAIYKSIKYFNILYSNMSGSTFKFNSSISSEYVENILKPILNDNIDKLTLINFILNYIKEDLNKLTKIKELVNNISIIDCDECGSTMEYLESRKSYCCGNEDCFNEKANLKE